MLRDRLSRMTNEEVADASQKFQLALRKAITLFEEETGRTVQSIEIHRDKNEQWVSEIK